MAPLPKECGPAHRLKFTPDSRSLVHVSQTGQIYIFKLNINEPSITLNFALNKPNLLKDAVHLLEISANGQYIVAGDHESNIVVWNRNEVTLFT